jgi:hypothetical protein
MRVSEHVQCSEFPCADVRHECHIVPTVDINPEGVSITLIFRGRRAFPSYLQAGPAYSVEKSKRRMSAEDIAAALKLAG